VPIQLRVRARGADTSRRVLLAEGETRVRLPEGFESALVNEGGHGFYRVRYTPELRQRLLARLDDGLAPIERFNFLNDAWAATLAGLVPIGDYVDLTARFRGERDKNVWAIVNASFAALNRVIDAPDRPRLEALVRDRVSPMVTELGWEPRPGENDLVRQLRGDLLRALGVLGNDAGCQAKAAELYAAARRDPHAVDPNVLPALIAILAHAGDAQRYDEFLASFRAAATPQEEQRYLYALTAFRSVPLLEQTLARTVNGEIRTQDAPFVVRSLLMNVYGRETGWRFVKTNWDTMDRQYPKHGLRRMCEGVIGLATRELERDVHAFFADRNIDLGGRTLEQYLEQLRVAVTFRDRDGKSLSAALSAVADAARGPR
jgi:puromycin-sensitive aminopeptidase